MTFRTTCGMASQKTCANTDGKKRTAEKTKIRARLSPAVLEIGGHGSFVNKKSFYRFR